MDEKQVVTYADAGVDIDAGERAVRLMKQYVRETFNPAVLAELGTFGAMYDLGNGTVLIASADGAGTKLKVAVMANIHDTVGQCLANHCANDILVQGATPLFMMDYFATGKLNPEVAAEVIKGLTIGCKANNCALIGGETAEMPDMYAPGEYDLAAFIVGIADKKRIITGSTIAPGCKIIGITSNGLHTNGYSLARKLLFEVAGLKIDDMLPDGNTVGRELLRVHQSYFDPVWRLMQEGAIEGAAHITGGGLPGNLIRCLPEGCRAILDSKSWDEPMIFQVLQEIGGFSNAEKFRTFNDGVGFALVTFQADYVLSELAKTRFASFSWEIGEIVEGERGVEIN